MKYIFVIFFAAIFIFISWLLNKLAGGNIYRIFKWTKYVYLILCPLSCFMWIYESYKNNSWFDPTRNLYIVILSVNILFIAILLLVWFIKAKTKIRTQKTSLMYGISYHETTSRFANTDDEPRLMNMMVLSLVANPILNIVCIVVFINTYIM